MENRSVSETITLILADDHEVVRRGLTAFLATASDVELLAVAATGGEAVAAARLYAPDVVLLDLFMPDQPAVETVRQIKRASPRSQIVMVTSHEGDDPEDDLPFEGDHEIHTHSWDPQVRALYDKAKKK